MGKISDPLTLKPVIYLFEGLKIDIIVSVENLRNNILNIKIDQIDKPIKIIESIIYYTNIKKI